MAGADPNNPHQFASPPLEDALRGFYRDDPVQPWIPSASAPNAVQAQSQTPARMPATRDHAHERTPGAKRPSSHGTRDAMALYTAGKSSKH
jgi:hypothetical protein